MSLDIQSTYHQFTEAMLSGTDAWKSFVAEDVLLIGPLGEFPGREAFIEINTPFFESIQKHEIHREIVNGDWVLTQISTTVELPTSAKITLEVAEWYMIQDGKIKYLRTYFDPSEYMAEMSKLG